MRHSPVLSGKIIVRFHQITLIAAYALISQMRGAYAETVEVKYRGPVQLDSFKCTDIFRSSFIRRVCYDREDSYLLLNLNGTYYHYCEVPVSVVNELLNAPSMGSYYGNAIKGKGGMGPYDCRVKKVPGER